MTCTHELCEHVMDDMSWGTCHGEHVVGNMSWGTCRGYMLWVQKDIHPRHTPTTCTHDMYPRYIPTRCTHDMHPRHAPTTCTHDMLSTRCYPRYVVHEMFTNWPSRSLISFDVSTTCSPVTHDMFRCYPRALHTTTTSDTHEPCREVICKPLEPGINSGELLPTT